MGAVQHTRAAGIARLNAGKDGHCDCRLQYLKKEECTFDREAMPKTSKWPAPGKRHLFPFDGLTDYLRALGPGVYVGLGWNYTAKRKIKRRFLPFLMIQDPNV